MAKDQDDTDFLNMSDEDMMNASPSAAVIQAATQVVAKDGSNEGQTDPAFVAATSEDTDDDQEGGKSESDEGDKDAAPASSITKPVAATQEEDKTALAATTETPVGEADKEVDYKAEFARLTTPFKANGKDIQVNNVDDAIALMQMGANYNKKMAALKPHLRLMKMLENNQLMTEEKISYLIDLEKKNPAAIQKLFKESGIDPLSIDSDNPGDYKPTSYKVDDREVDLDTALDEIQDSPAYNRTLEILGTKWDGPSKQVIANAPQLVKVINDHVQNGIYDVISKEVERERMFGRLNGMSDIDAYRQVGDALQERGGFSHLMQQEKKAPTAPVVVVPKSSVADEDKLREKRRAASGSAPSAATAKTADYNPLSLSDDAFNKIVNEKFL